MDRVDFYFRQLVTEAELDDAFNKAEIADRAMVADLGLTGITTGMGVAEITPVANLTVNVGGPGVAYDNAGQRVFIPSTQAVDCSIDEVGSGTAVATPGNEKWLSIFVKFDRVLSDPRLDGNSATVFYQRSETFELNVAQGAEAAIGLATKQPLRADEILLADVYLINGQTQILNADIFTDRREDLITFDGASLSVKGLTFNAAFDVFGQGLEDHFIAGTAHNADQIAYAGGPAWADGTTNPAGFVEAQLDKIITDLTGAAGTAKINGAAVSSSSLNLTSDRLDNQLGQVLDLVALRGELAGNNTWAGTQTFSNSVTANSTLTAADELILGANISSTASDAITSRITADVVPGATNKATEVIAVTPPAGDTSGGVRIHYIPDDNLVTGTPSYPQEHGLLISNNIAWDTVADEWQAEVTGPVTTVQIGSSSDDTTNGLPDNGFQVLHNESVTAGSQFVPAGALSFTSYQAGLGLDRVSLSLSSTAVNDGGATRLTNFGLQFTTLDSSANSASSNLPPTTAPLSNTLYASNIPKCWGRVSAGVLLDGFNVSSASAGPTVLQVSTGTSLGAGGYTVVANIHSDIPYFCTVTVLSVSTFNINVHDTAGSSVDTTSLEIGFVVFGRS